jgi:hypothetical protein
MPRIAIVSDIHYAGPSEQARGSDYELATAKPSLARTLIRFYRRHVWMKDPLAHNGLLDRFIEQAGAADLVIANGDYTCDSAAIGVSDDAACESVQLCLGKLRSRFGGKFHAILGDHELGKVSLLGDRGGLRLKSWQCATGECGLQPFWRVELGNFILLGITSTLVALPVFLSEAPEDERTEWERLRENHLAEIRAAFESLRPGQRVILFCHDPTALPFLWREPTVQTRAGQIAQTIIGHLHTKLVFWKSRMLAGMPVIRSGGVSIQRMTTALNEARHWKPFNVRLCPALAGIELLKDGGFLTMELDESGVMPPKVCFHPLRR